MLSVAEAARIAHLARLSLSSEEQERYALQLSAILDYAAELAQVDVEGIPPTASVLSTHNVMRDDDVAANGITREAALGNAPLADENYFVVQATISDDDM